MVGAIQIGHNRRKERQTQTGPQRAGSFGGVDARLLQQRTTETSDGQVHITTHDAGCFHTPGNKSRFVLQDWNQVGYLIGYGYGYRISCEKATRSQDVVTVPLLLRL